VDETPEPHLVAADLLTYGISIAKNNKRIDPRDFLLKDNFDEEFEALRKRVGNEVVRKYAKKWGDLLPRKTNGEK
jgi:hypothetical protein